MKTQALARDPGAAEAELDRLLAAFCADPSDDDTFAQLELLLRGNGRFELVRDSPGYAGESIRTPNRARRMV